MPEAGRIIGGGRRAFQKYESGATPPSEAAGSACASQPTEQSPCSGKTGFEDWRRTQAGAGGLTKASKGYVM